MSRHIQTVQSEKQPNSNIPNGNKLIFTNVNQMLFCFYLQGDQLVNVQKISLSPTSQIGEIYVGKIKNILHNIDSCFVEIANDQICYLPLKDVKEAEHLAAGVELPVQIKRNAIKTKPAAVTTAIELGSEYFVFKKNMRGIGISEKIKKETAAHIKELLHDIPFESCGVIVRTKCQELDDKSLLEIFHKQQQEFDRIFEKAKYSTCFTCIKKGNPPIVSFIQENSSWEYDTIITDIPEIYEDISSNDFHNDVNIVLYKEDEIALKTLYGLQSKLEDACNKKVWLKSGANLIIEQTECLTAIDVNSSKNISKKDRLNSVFHINLEAAKEAARQIRLRNLSGIIIIDFINMERDDDKNALLNALREFVSSDPVTTRVIDMTPLGLVEITRKKVHMSLIEQVKEIY